MSALSMSGAIPCRRRAARRRAAIGRLLTLAVAYWLVHRRWPQLLLLQKDLLRRSDERFSPLRALRHLPPDCGFVDDDCLVVTVKGLDRTGAAESLLADYLDVVRLAYERYLRSGADIPVISAADLVETVRLSEERAELVGQLLDAEHELFAPAHEDGGRVWTVRNGIDAYREADTVDRYLAIRSEGAANEGVAPTSLRARVTGWFEGVQPSRRDLLVIAVLAALLAVFVQLAIGFTPLAPSSTTTTTTVPARLPSVRRAHPRRRAASKAAGRSRAEPHAGHPPRAP